jgi:hypothetical protein
MKPPLLFLDIDGVLNSVQYYKKMKYVPQQPSVRTFRHMLDESAVAHLQTIIDHTQCEVVITSTWRRIYELEEIIRIFEDAGLRMPVPFIGTTPIFHGSNMYGMRRGDEVRAWMNKLPLRGVDRTYCCIDDGNGYLPTQNLVLVDNEYGIRAMDVERIVHILSARRATIKNR